jgi:hypothetical protein
VVAIWGVGEKIVGEEDEPEVVCASLDGSQSGHGPKSLDDYHSHFQVKTRTDAVN